LIRYSQAKEVADMQTEELLTGAESIVRAKFPDGIKGMVSEVYMRTSFGGWICKPYMVRSKKQSAANARVVALMIAAMEHHGILVGVVQVSSGWIVEGSPLLPVLDPQQHPARKEILLFNGRGPHGPRIRVYEVTRKGKHKLPSRLVGAFAMYPEGRE
jgi:hypothetical protein